jgi:hypothetical protein
MKPHALGGVVALAVVLVDQIVKAGTEAFRSACSPAILPWGRSRWWR